MKTESKKEKDLQPLSIERVKSIVENYFDGVEVPTLNIYYPDFGKLRIHVIYMDFKPEQTVKEELEKLLPLSIVKAERNISTEAGKKVFFEAWHNLQSWDMLIDGKIRSVSLYQIIEQHLEDKTL